MVLRRPDLEMFVFHMRLNAGPPARRALAEYRAWM